MADQNLGTYSPEDLIIIISANEISHAAAGFAEGTIATVEKTTPHSTLVLNGDKGGGRVFRSTSDGTITLVLNQWAYTNDILTLLLKNDAETRDSTWLFSMSLIDGTGRSAHHARQCFIENFPSTSYGTELETREWVIHSADMEHYIGGNGKLPPEVIATIEKLGGTVPPRWR